MSRFTHSATSSGWTVVAVRASLPTAVSSSENSTTLGVSRSPSALRIIAVRPDSSTQATAEKVVPRSIPIGCSRGIGKTAAAEEAEKDQRDRLAIHNLPNLLVYLGWPNSSRRRCLTGWRSTVVGIFAGPMWPPCGRPLNGEGMTTPRSMGHMGGRSAATGAGISRLLCYGYGRHGTHYDRGTTVASLGSWAMRIGSGRTYYDVAGRIRARGNCSEGG